MNANLRPVFVESNLFGKDGMVLILTDARTVSQLRDAIYAQCGREFNISRDTLNKMKFVDSEANDYKGPDSKIPFLKNMDWSASPEERIAACCWKDETQTEPDPEQLYAMGHDTTFQMSENNKFIQSGAAVSRTTAISFIADNGFEADFMAKYQKSYVTATNAELQEYYSSMTGTTVPVSEEPAPVAKADSSCHCSGSCGNQELIRIVNSQAAKISALEAELRHMSAFLNEEMDYVGGPAEASCSTASTRCRVAFDKTKFTLNR